MTRLKKRTDQMETVIPQPRKAKGGTLRFVAHTKRGWTQAEEKELRVDALNMTDLEIAEKTGRTYSSIVNKRQALGIEKFAKQRANTKRAKARKAKRSEPLTRTHVIAKGAEVNDNRGPEVKAALTRLTAPKGKLANLSATISLDSNTGLHDYVACLLAAQQAGFQVSLR